MEIKCFHNSCLFKILIDIDGKSLDIDSLEEKNEKIFDLLRNY